MCIVTYLGPQLHALIIEESFRLLLYRFSPPRQLKPALQDGCEHRIRLDTDLFTIKTVTDPLCHQSHADTAWLIRPRDFATDLLEFRDDSLHVFRSADFFA